MSLSEAGLVRLAWHQSEFPRGRPKKRKLLSEESK